MRQVTGENFGYGLFSAENWAKHITVEDSAMLDHKSQIRSAFVLFYHVNSSVLLPLHSICTNRSYYILSSFIVIMPEGDVGTLLILIERSSFFCNAYSHEEVDMILCLIQG